MKWIGYTFIAVGALIFITESPPWIRGILMMLCGWRLTLPDINKNAGTMKSATTSGAIK